MTSLTFIIIYLLTVPEISRSANLIGIQVMEMEDLQLLQASNEVGNLAYGDYCMNNGALVITDDVCFHSNPLFQCNDGKCSCAFVRLADELGAEQMIFENGKCKRPLHFSCTTSEDCVNGLSCIAGATKSSTESRLSPYHLHPREEDEEPNDERLTSYNVYRKRIKATIKAISGISLKQRNIQTTSKPIVTTIGEVSSLDVEADEVGMNNMDFELQSTNISTLIASRRQAMFCLNTCSSMLLQIPKFYLNVALTIIHCAINFLCIKI